MKYRNSPAPGPQTPEKYPAPVGPNYRRLGEQAGRVYNPYTDRYISDPVAQRKYLEDNNLIEKKPKEKGLLKQSGPVVVGAGVLVGSQSAGKYLDQEVFGTEAKVPTTVDPTVPVDTSGAGTGNTGPTSPTGTTPVTTTPGTAAPAPINVPANTAVPDGYTVIGNNIDGSLTAIPSTPDTGVLGSGYTGTQIAQGGLGLLQTGMGLNQLRQGEYVGGTLNTVSGANAAVAAYNSSPGVVGSGFLPTAVAGPLAAAAGIYQGYKTAEMIASAPSGGKRNSNAVMGGAAAGAAIGSVVPVVGTAIGAVIGATVGLAGSYFGSSKGGMQMSRDSLRKYLVGAKLLDADFNGTLADGSKYNFGGDGSKIKVDYKNPVDGRVIGLANVISTTEGLTGKSGQAAAALYTSGAMSNSGGNYDVAKANVLHFAQQRGFTLPIVIAQIEKLKKEGRITADQANAYTGGANELFNGQQQQQQVGTRQPVVGTVQTGRGLLRKR